MLRFLTNTRKTPVIAELVQLASKHTGLSVTYEDSPASAADVADQEGRDNPSYRPSADYGSIWTTLTGDLKPFWTELDRLKVLVTKPLDEPVFSDDHPLYQGLIYVANGKPKMFIDGERMTVGRWKALDIKGVEKVREVRRCDMIGRLHRLPEKKPETSFPTMTDSWNASGCTSGQAKRRPRSSNKIKKVK